METVRSNARRVVGNVFKYLFEEYHGEVQNSHRFSVTEQLEYIHALLTIRDPDHGDLPQPIQEDVDRLLEIESERNPLPKVETTTLPTLSQQLHVVDSRMSLAFAHMSFYKGDITRLSSPTLAIVNAANTRALGCFQPSHKCIDNVIHAAAGPRLRLDCARIMNEFGTENLEVGQPIITNSWSLPSGKVIHVAGPQLTRGAEPTEQEMKQLERAYRDSMELAASTEGVESVAFPCISTGMFAFPAPLAATIALQTVVAWLESHPTHSLKVIFTLFSASDAQHYVKALSTLYPSLEVTDKLVTTTPPNVVLVEKARKWLKEADGLIIHAGAGLSAVAVDEKLGYGLDYESRELFKAIYPGLLKSTSLTRLYETIGYTFKDPLVQWAYILAHGYNVSHWGQTPIYQSLLSIAQSKSSYTVLTSNADNLFAHSSFDVSRLYTPQGSYMNFQCLEPCTPKSFFPSAPWFEAAHGLIDHSTMRLPPDRTDLIPVCKVCGGPVFLNVRGGNWFLETPQKGQRERYWQQVEKMVEVAESKGKAVVVLEIGAGFSTPSVVRYPSEDLVREYPGVVKLVRLNLFGPDVPIDLDIESAIGISVDAAPFVESL